MDLRGGRGGGGGGEQVSSEELCLEEQRDTVGKRAGVSSKQQKIHVRFLDALRYMVNELKFLFLLAINVKFLNVSQTRCCLSAY